MKNHISYGKFLFLSCLLIAGVLGCFVTSRFSGWTIDVGTEEVFAYNADNILQIITNDEVGQSTFRLDSTSDEEAPTVDLFWSQDDYLTLAEGFHEWYLDEATEDWMLFEIIFIADCTEIREYPNATSDAFNRAKVIVSYYKPDVSFRTGVPNRKVNILTLLPTINYLLISEATYNPMPRIPEVNLPEWGSLNTQEMKIKAEKAYEIAEMAGGREFDQCTFTAMYSLDDKYNGWDVKFFNTELGYSFEIIINDQTGEYEIISE